MENHSLRDVILERLSIIDVISTYTKLELSGKNYKAKSPFTNEKTPSFFVSPDKGLFYCFSSQKGGDLFTFIQEIEGVDFKGALKILADRAGIDVKNYSAPNKREAKEKEESLKVLQKANQLFIGSLNKKVIDYLNKRGIDYENIKKWEIGFAQDSWSNLKDSLKKEFEENVLEKAGLILKGDKGSYDRFRKRIIFPLIDENNKLIGFAGRIFGKDEGAKYINSPETILYHKSSYLYGFNKAKLSIRKLDFSILMEGYIDVILSHKIGYTTAVASSGTSVTKEHLTKLSRLSNKIIIAYDGDESGIKASIRSAEIAFSLGMEVRIASFKDGKDPADVILKSPEEFKDAIKDAMPIIDFLLKRIKDKDNNDDTHLIKEVQNTVIPIISSVNDKMLKDRYIKKIAEFCDVTEDSVVGFIQTKDSNEEYVKKVTKSDTEPKGKRQVKEVFEAYEYLNNIGCEIGGAYEKILSEIRKYTERPEIKVDTAKARYEVEGEEDGKSVALSVLKEQSVLLLEMILKDRLEKFSSSDDKKSDKECASINAELRELDKLRKT